MQTMDSPDSALKDFLVVDDPRQIRLIFSEKHSLVLRRITEKELSISEIARELGFNPGSVHYYLKELEKYGLARQVRQEIKGGIVKKFYRAPARRIVLASPDFEDPASRHLASDDELCERFLRSIEACGYCVAEGDREEAKELLLRYDHLMKGIFKELFSEALTKEELAGPPNPAFQLLVHVKAQETPELGRIISQFHKLFKVVG